MNKFIVCNSKIVGLQFALKILTLLQLRTSLGREFQSFGAATLKARSPSVFLCVKFKIILGHSTVMDASRSEHLRHIFWSMVV